MTPNVATPNEPDYADLPKLPDLEATLDQYPDDVTREVREILAGQTAAAYHNRVPTQGRYWCRGF